MATVTPMQLVTVRVLLDHAAMSLAQGGPVGAAVAMLVADLALETLLSQAVSDLGLTVGDRDSTHQLVEKLVGARPALAARAELQSVRRLRRARNPVQHAGFVPEEASVQAHLRDAEAAAELIVQEVYGERFSEVSVAGLIRDEEIRGLLEQALDELRAGHLDEAVSFTAAAFGLVYTRCGYWVRRIMDVSPTEEEFTPARLDPVIATVLGPDHPDVASPKTEHPWWRELTWLALGIPLPQLLSMKGLQQRAHALVAARDEAPLADGAQPSVEQVRLVIDELARHVWRLETAEPEILARSRTR